MSDTIQALGRDKPLSLHVLAWELVDGPSRLNVLVTAVAPFDMDSVGSEIVGQLAVSALGALPSGCSAILINAVRPLAGGVPIVRGATIELVAQMVAEPRP